MAEHLATVANWTTGPEVRGLKLTEELVAKVVGGESTSSVVAAERLRGDSFFAIYVGVARAEPNWSVQQIQQYISDNITMTN